jgi:hypothetical protein
MAGAFHDLDLVAATVGADGELRHHDALDAVRIGRLRGVDLERRP